MSNSVIAARSRGTPAALVRSLCELAGRAGTHGIVASPHEAALAREILGADRLVVCPGIRGADDAADDQRRIATAEAAIRAGASHVVIGRPIRDAGDPAARAQSFVREIEAALGG